MEGLLGILWKLGSCASCAVASVASWGRMEGTGRLRKEGKLGRKARQDAPYNGRDHGILYIVV